MKGKRLLRLFSAMAVVALVFAARARSSPAAAERLIHLTAKKFEYSPSEITVKKGEPVVIEVVSLDRKHGFTIPELKVRSDVKPGEKNVVRFTPDKAGKFNFHCDLFCGSGHEGMEGTLVVVEQ
jgi:cytochrome c oxidase subunit II